MNEHIISFYDQHAESFKVQYLSTTAEEVHKSWLDKFLPASGLALDIGAGAGRDALFLAKKGLKVFAVEPAEQLAKIGMSTTNRFKEVVWIDDRLPELNKITALNLNFDLVLMTAVWMHIPTHLRGAAFKAVSDLLNANGYLVISLRHGVSPDEREMFEVSVHEITDLAKEHNLRVMHIQSDNDSLSRKDVFWETVVLQS